MSVLHVYISLIITFVVLAVLIVLFTLSRVKEMFPGEGNQTAAPAVTPAGKERH